MHYGLTVVLTAKYDIHDPATNQILEKDSTYTELYFEVAHVDHNTNWAKVMTKTTVGVYDKFAKQLEDDPKVKNWKARVESVQVLPLVG